MRQQWLSRSSVALACVALVGGMARAQDRRLPPAAATRRVALLIGNDAYPAMPLHNAANDATAVAAALSEAGFSDPILVTNARRADMARAVERFLGRLEPGDVGLFFYAGHGIQLEGENYLVPVDFAAQDEIDAKDQSYRAQSVLDKMKAKGARLRLVVLDACRNNPFAAKRAAGGGLAAMEGTSGDFIAFATGAQKTAADNPGGRNGLFTAHFLEALKQPGLPLDQLFKRVKQGVYDSSNGQQMPYTYDGVLGEFVFRQGRPALPAGPALPPPPSGGLDLGDLERQAQARAQWGQYQSRMAADFAKAEAFETQAAQPADLKAMAWERFAESYAQDNPLSAEDERLRQEARSRMERWKSEAPSQAVAPAAQPQLKEKGKVVRGWVGVITQPIDDGLARTLNLKEPKGALVANVTPGGPAAKAGLLPGDVVMAVDATRVEDQDHLARLIAGKAPGTSVNLLLLHAGAEGTLTVVLGTFPDEDDREEQAETHKPAVQPAGAPGAEWVNPKDGLTYVSIPAGSFEMGCVASDRECRDDEKPRHTVRIGRGYWMGKTEVTVGAYRRFVSASGRGMPSAPDFNQGWSEQQHPVVNVDWNDAKAFCAWSGGRLPSEAEWEYAARGGRAGTKYPWGDKISHEQANYSGTGGRDRWKYSSPVGSFPANGFGLHDMIGNACEWVEDAYAESYSGAPSDGSARATGSNQRVMRQWGWGLDPDTIRVSHRGSLEPGHRVEGGGFRCARDGH